MSRTRKRGNPILAPIRRWVLWSRTRLAVTLGLVVFGLFVAGRITNAVYGEPVPTAAPEPRPAAAAFTATPSTPSPTGFAGPASQRNAPAAAAVGWATVFADPNPADAVWVSLLEPLSTRPLLTDPALLDARPAIPDAPVGKPSVDTAGPTRSTVTVELRSGTTVVLDAVDTADGWRIEALTPQDNPR